MSNEKQYAFWKYDQPPYILSGEILKFHPSGGVYVKGYDQNMTSYFTKESIIAILPETEAHAWENIISATMKSYAEMISAARQQFTNLRICLETHPKNQTKGDTI